METTRRIEQYLDGTLNLQEKHLLEEEADHNPELHELIRLHTEVNESIRDEDFFTFRDLVTGVSQEYFQTDSIDSGKNSVARKLWYNTFTRYAAIFILVACAGIGLKYLFSAPVSAEKLFGQYYSRYEADAITRSVSDKNSMDYAILSYSNQHYSQALSELNAITRSNPQNYLAWFYRGLTCLEVHASAEAVRSFRAIPPSWDSSYVEYRDWYLAMALLQNKNLAEAKTVLKQIKKAKGYYADQAGEILHMINP